MGKRCECMTMCVGNGKRFLSRCHSNYFQQLFLPYSFLFLLPNKNEFSSSYLCSQILISQNWDFFFVSFLLLYHLHFQVLFCFHFSILLIYLTFLLIAALIAQKNCLQNCHFLFVRETYLIIIGYCMVAL